MPAFGIPKNSGGGFSSTVASAGYSPQPKLHFAPQLATQDSPQEVPTKDAEVGPMLKLVAAGKPLDCSMEDAQEGARALLQALQSAYAEENFQTKIQGLHEQAAGNHDRYLWMLGPEASTVQQPVFLRFGLPPGGKGVIIMKNGIKKLSESSESLQKLAGDLREQLLLPREEPVVHDVRTLLDNVEREKQKHHTELVGRLSKAPARLLAPFAKAMDLPGDASVEVIANAALRIPEKAEELAKHRMAQSRDEICGPGKLLGPEMENLSDIELRSCLVQTFQHYLQKMLARIVTPIESFTADALEYRCEWAENLITKVHATSLWGTSGCLGGDGTEDWASLGVGIAVIDATVDLAILARAREVLDRMDANGDVNPSQDPCNVGAKSIWLNFGSAEERSKMHPDLCDLCLKIAGLPAALEARAKELPESQLVGWPKLRVHPHMLVANYRKGAQYHVHKDSYDGTDNTRMLSILLYLNPDWKPGDGGEFRAFATKQDSKQPAPEMSKYADIEPLAGRLLLFRSRDVWHAVREPIAPGLRWAMTLWVMAD